MEVRIKKIRTKPEKIPDRSSDVTEVYSVVDNGREFTVVIRLQRHGSSMSVVGLEGVLYTDRDSNTVRRQVITVGRSCGVTIDADELVEGLSVLAIRGVILANRTGETNEIRLVTDGSGSSEDQPIVFVNGQATDLHQSS